MKTFLNSIQGNFYILYQFLLSYFIILLLPVFLGGIIYSQTIGIVEDLVYEQNRRTLNQAVGVIDQRFTELENVLFNMSFNPRLLGFSGAKTEKPEYVLDLIRLQKELFPYDLTNTFVAHFLIAFRESNLMVSPSTVYTIDSFYHEFARYEGKTADEFKSELFSRNHYLRSLPHRTVSLIHEDRTIETIPLLHSMNGFGGRDTVALVHIPLKSVEELFTHVLRDERASVYIMNKNNEILYASREGGLPSIIQNNNNSGNVPDNAEFSMTSIESEKAGWKCFILQPKDTILEIIYTIRRTTFIILLIILIIGFLLSAAISYRFSSPLRELIAWIKKDRGLKNPDFKALSRSVTDLLSDHEHALSLLNRQRPFIRKIFFERLLNGTIQNRADIETYLNHTSLSIRKGFFTVIIYWFYGYHNKVNETILKELDIKRGLLKKVIENLPEAFLYTAEPEPDRIVTILFQKQESPDTASGEGYVSETISTVIETLPEEISKILRISIGGTAGSLNGIHTSYNQANSILDHFGSYPESNILMHSQLAKKIQQYYYPLEIEFRLVSALKAGNKDVCEAIINEVFTENIENRILSSEMRTSLIHEMRGTYSKAIGQIPGMEQHKRNVLQNEIQEINPGSNLFDVKSHFTHLNTHVCGIIHENKKSHNVSLTSRITSFLETRYSSPELTLTMLAEKFSMSDVYLSAFFKEQTGENFKGYLERIRMDQACRLLVETGNSVKDVANKVGYDNVNSFCRAFKRRFQSSPGQYRTQNKHQVNSNSLSSGSNDRNYHFSHKQI